MIFRAAYPWILQARAIIGRVLRAVLYMIFKLFEEGRLDTFASEIGREACLIDRSTLSLRDVYAFKYIGWSFVETVVHPFSTNAELLSTPSSHLRKLLPIGEGKRFYERLFQSVWLRIELYYCERRIRGRRPRSYGVSTSFAKAFSSFRF